MTRALVRFLGYYSINDYIRSSYSTVEFSDIPVIVGRKLQHPTVFAVYCCACTHINENFILNKEMYTFVVSSAVVCYIRLIVALFSIKQVCTYTFVCQRSCFLHAVCI